MWLSEARAALLGTQKYQKYASASKKRRLGYHEILHEPRLRIFECIADRDLRVVRVDVASMTEVPLMISNDQEKEAFVRSTPDEIDGLLIVLRELVEEDEYIAYCELILKSEVKKSCKMTTWSFPTVQELPLGIQPPEIYQVHRDFVIPAGTTLYHAPQQVPYKDKNASMYDKERVEGAKADHVIYFGLRPVECFSRYTKLIQERKNQAFERGMQILKQVGRSKELEDTLDFENRIS